MHEAGHWVVPVAILLPGLFLLSHGLEAFRLEWDRKCNHIISYHPAYSPALSFRAGMTLDTFLDVNRKVVDLPYFVVDILGVFSA